LGRPDETRIRQEINTLAWVINDRERQICDLIRNGNPDAVATLLPSLTALQTHDLGRRGGIMWMLGLSDVGPAAPRYQPRAGQ
jgi:hypothetical protein